MKTFKQILKETWSTPPDAPQHSAYHSTAPRKGSKFDFSVGMYSPPADKVASLSTGKGTYKTTSTGDTLKSQELTIGDDHPAFRTREDAEAELSRQIARVGRINPTISPKHYDQEKEHAGVVVKTKTNGSYPYTLSNITKDSGDFSARYHVSQNVPGKAVSMQHMHPLSKQDPEQRAVAGRFSTADTSIPKFIDDIQKGKARDTSEYPDTNKYASPSAEMPKDRFQMQLVYPNKSGHGWHGASFDMERDKDKLETINATRKDDGRSGHLLKSPDKNLYSDTTHGVDLGDIKPEEPTAKAHPYADYNSSTAHDEHEFEYSGPELYAANKGKKLGEGMVASFLNKRKTGTN